MTKKQAIKNLALRYQPREKLRQRGIQALSNRELLAIIISSGLKNCNVLELAQKVERQIFDQNKKVSTASLTQIFGIGEILANKILASLELGYRFIQNQHLTQINNPEKIFALSSELGHKKQEYCLAFYLNGRQELLSKQTVAIGGLNYNFLEPRAIFAPALQLGADSFILVHNHPSGNVEPSEDDLLLTKKISSLAELMGLKLLDHLIVTKGNFYSIRQHCATYLQAEIVF